MRNSCTGRTTSALRLMRETRELEIPLAHGSDMQCTSRVPSACERDTAGIGWLRCRFWNKETLLRKGKQMQSRFQLGIGLLACVMVAGCSQEKMEQSVQSAQQSAQSAAKAAGDAAQAAGDAAANAQK